jgi:hypothetical protein
MVCELLLLISRIRGVHIDAIYSAREDSHVGFINIVELYFPDGYREPL